MSNAAIADISTTVLPDSGEMHKVPIVNCGIMFGDGGKNSPWIKLKNNRITKPKDIGGPWSFIRKTYGPCSFMIYNKHNLKGNRVNYGSEIRTKIRVASAATADKGGWKARSVIITPHKKSACRITLYGSRKGRKGLSTVFSYIEQTFYGPSRISDITAWSIVSNTTGNNDCTYTLYKQKNLSGKSSTVKKIDKNLRIGWKIRSIEISQ